MGSRTDLQSELLTFLPNVYYQPPANLKMAYPCIVYTRTGKNRHFADDVIYLSQQGYQLTVIEHDPDSDIADRIEKHFQSCAINNYFITDNLHHTTISLYY